MLDENDMNEVIEHLMKIIISSNLREINPSTTLLFLKNPASLTPEERNILELEIEQRTSDMQKETNIILARVSKTIREFEIDSKRKINYTKQDADNERKTWIDQR